MFHRLSHLLAATAGAAVLVVAAPASAGAAPSNCPGADALPTPSTLSAARSATLCLLNTVRRADSLRPLHANRRLRRAADRYSRQMVRRSFFNHVSPTGSTLVSRVRATHYLH